MKRVAALAFLVIIVIVGGGLTSQLMTEAPIIIQSDVPDASVFEATPQQAAQFIFWTLFVLGNVVVVGLVLAFLFWRGNVEVRKAEAMPKASEQRPEQQLPEESVVRVS